MSNAYFRSALCIRTKNPNLCQSKSFNWSIDINAIYFCKVFVQHYNPMCLPEAVKHRSQGGWLQIISSGSPWNLKLDKCYETKGKWRLFLEDTFMVEKWSTTVWRLINHCEVLIATSKPKLSMQPPCNLCNLSETCLDWDLPLPITVQQCSLLRALILEYTFLYPRT